MDDFKQNMAHGKTLATWALTVGCPSHGVVISHMGDPIPILYDQLTYAITHSKHICNFNFRLFLPCFVLFNFFKGKQTKKFPVMTDKQNFKES